MSYNEMSGFGDLSSDQAAASTFIWSATQASRAKFQFQDRIADADVNGIITAIASYVSSNSGYSGADVPQGAAGIFWTYLSPNTQSEWKKTVNNIVGYRLSPDTLNAAGTQIGNAVNALRARVSGSTTGVVYLGPPLPPGFNPDGGGGGGGGTSFITTLTSHPLYLGIGALAIIGVGYYLKKRKKGTAKKSRR